MKDPVRIKCNRYGLIIYFDPELPFDRLLTAVTEKFRVSAAFFDHARLVVQFEGRTFTKEEEQKMVEAIESAADISILCIVEENSPTERLHQRALEETLVQTQDSEGLFYRGTLRGKQILESEKSIVIIGDVEAGATVVSRGNVIVTGSIFGSVTAGAAGDIDALIAALYMRPRRLRIGEIEVKPVIGGSYSWAKLL